MTTARIEVSSHTLGDIEVKREYSQVKPFDDDHMRAQIAALLAAATDQVRRAYGIAEEGR